MKELQALLMALSQHQAASAYQETERLTPASKPKRYELRTLKDLFDRIPPNKLRECVAELYDMLAQAQGVRSDIEALAEASGVPIPTDGSHMIFPETVTWVDDGKGEVRVEVEVKPEPTKPTPVVKDKVTAENDLRIWLIENGHSDLIRVIDSYLRAYPTYDIFDVVDQLDSRTYHAYCESQS